MFCLFLALTAPSARPLERTVAVLGSLTPVGFILATRVVVHGALTNEPLGVGWTGSPLGFFLDLLEIPSAGAHGPGPVRTLFRSVVVVAGLFGAVRFHRSRDSRRLAILPLAVSGLVVAHVGSFVKATWPLDPPLFAIPSVLLLVGPACEVVLGIPWRELTFHRGLAGRAGLAVAVVLGVPRLVRTVGTYVPELLPVAAVRAPGDASKSSLVGLFEPMPDALPYAPAPPALIDVAGFLTANVQEGRVLALDASVAALLTVRSPLDVLGPIAERGAPSADADPTSLLSPRTTWDTAGRYLEHYAVTWVVLPLTPSVFDGEHPELGPVLPVFGYRVRKVLHPTALVLEGDATVKDRHLGFIHVESAGRERVTLRMHYDERLGCRPGCRVERRQVDFDRAGFITVSEPPSELEIFLR
jgi:hypothetical protein